MVEAHSWADCVDWRFNNPKKPGWLDTNGKCFGWARQYPINSGISFGGLDRASPNRHYQQAEDFTPCSDGKHGKEPGADETRQNPISKAYGGRFGAMTREVLPGDSLCVRWPAKNHAVPSERDRGVFINMPPAPTTKDPNQDQLMKMTIAKLPYKNCSFTGSKDSKDRSPCGGCFKVPEDRVPGNYLIQWRWELNDHEWYTSCWDLKVGAPPAPVVPQPSGAVGPVPTQPITSSSLGGSTSVFADLTED
ncbi:hypothetical protein EMPS_08912 [Entomortierella parvispora]|uniref:Chitin-binding type-4 domain-containing protein n=1 Tax=Entomortierella parvispora TaxID=205924 RepID=A0A9P3LZU0_9FUNG|nr:hypothetical protein EMPS_08912 [Entomortierella parvispora]